MNKIIRKKKIVILSSLLTLLVLTTLFSTSCNNRRQDYQSQIDSLNATIEQLNSDYQELNNYLIVISNCLDSISLQENFIFNSGNEKPLPKREEIEQELTVLQQTLKNQRMQIEKLEQQMKSGNDATKKLRTIVISLKAQLVEKENQIATLQEELSQRNITIEQLGSRINALASQSNLQKEMIASQHSTLQEQDNQLNEAFIKIATKAELKEAGLLSGGFLKKSKIDYSKMDRKMFRSIDMRVVTEVEINSKSPKILTSVPDGTYTMSVKGEKTILHIQDPTRFWKVSRFLIIQL